MWTLRAPMWTKSKRAAAGLLSRYALSRCCHVTKNPKNAKPLTPPLVARANLLFGIWGGELNSPAAERLALLRLKCARIRAPLLRLFSRGLVGVDKDLVEV
eukprot:7437449-Pyramimonas_sp.AAC.2